MDEHSLIRAHSRALGGSNATASMLQDPSDFSAPVVLPSASQPKSKGKKKAARRVVEDILSVDHEYEEKERMRAERKARNHSSNGAIVTENESQPESQVTTPNPAASASGSSGSVATPVQQPVSFPLISATPVTTVQPTPASVTPIAPVAVIEPAAPPFIEPSIMPTESASLTQSPDRATVRGRHSMQPEGEVVDGNVNGAGDLSKGSKASVAPAEAKLDNATPASVIPPPVQPRSIFVAEEPKLASSGSFRKVSDSETIPQPQGRSRSASNVSSVQVEKAPAQPTQTQAAAPAPTEPVTPVRKGKRDSALGAEVVDPAPFTPQPDPYTSPPRASTAQNAPPVTSPAVTTQDLAALDALGSPGLTKVVESMSQARKLPGQSNLTQQMEAAAAQDPKLRKIVVATNGPPLSVPSSHPPTPILTAAAAAAKKPRHVLLERTDDYDIWLNQLASSPAMDSSPQLRAMAAGLGGSGSPGSSSSHLPPSSSSANILSRPQLASLGLAYVSDYFTGNGDEPVKGKAPDSLPPTPASPTKGATTSTTSNSNGSGAIAIPARRTGGSKEEKDPGYDYSDEEDASELQPGGFPTGSPIGIGNHIKTLIRPVTREPPKELMKRQNSQCAGCEQSIFLGLFTKPRYCHYTGGLYCSQCHVKDKRVIPGKVLTLGDRSLYKVCSLAAAYLDTMYSIPSIPMAAISPNLYHSYKDLGLVFVLRQQLAHIRAFILTCKKKDALLKLLGQRQYMLNDTLVRTSAGEQTPPSTAATPQPSELSQSVTSDSMPTVQIGSFFPQKSLLPTSNQQLPLTMTGPIATAVAAAVERHGPSSSPPTRTSADRPYPSSSPPVQSAFRSGSSRSIVSSRGSNSPRAGSGNRREEPEGDGSARAADGFDPLQDDPILSPTLRDMYSLRDIVEILSGAFLPRLTTVVRQLMAHIVGGRCDLCSSKAFYCEYADCDHPQQAIYAFQLNQVVQCGSCLQCFHRDCYEIDTCPKCARINTRKLAQAQRIVAAKANQVHRMNSGLNSLSSSPASSSALAIPQPPVERGRLGFQPTTSVNRSSEVSIERRTSSSRGASPVRAMNERIKNRSASPAPITR